MNRISYRQLIIFILASFLLVLQLGGCAGKKIHGGGDQKGDFLSIFTPDDADTEENDEAKVMAREAMDFFRRGRYLLAEEIFQKIRDRFPFSPYATLAELRLADCKFFNSAYEEAIPLYEEFEKLHPTNEAIPYVIFQEGTAYYRLMDTPDRDQSYTHKMIKTYERLLKRYPGSPYELEAKRRIAEGRNLLAEHEIVVAKWYLRVGKIKQARLRLNTVLERYPDTAAKAKAEIMLSRIRDIDEGAGEKSVHTEEGKKDSWWRRLIPFV